MLLLAYLSASLRFRSFILRSMLLQLKKTISLKVGHPKLQKQRKMQPILPHLLKVLENTT